MESSDNTIFSLVKMIPGDLHYPRARPFAIKLVPLIWIYQTEENEKLSHNAVLELFSSRSLSCVSISSVSLPCLHSTKCTWDDIFSRYAWWNYNYWLNVVGPPALLGVCLNCYFLEQILAFPVKLFMFILCPIHPAAIALPEEKP